MKKIFVARRIPSIGIEMLSQHFDVDVWEDPMPPPPAILLQRARGCAGILSLLSDVIDRRVMEELGETLQAVANFAVGYNNIDVTAARELEIQVGNTPDVLTDATADVAVGLILTAARQFQASIDQVRRLEWKTWEPLGLLGQDLKGKTLGILGMGRIGLAVAERLHFGWGMKVIYSARSDKSDMVSKLNASRVSVEQLLQESDFISIHTDLNPGTKHLIRAETLRLLKPNAVLVNTSRGGVIDQEALYDALKSGGLFAAGLDVTDPEPLPGDCRLRELQNCIILPHIGSATFEARNAMSRMAAQNLIEALHGRSMPFAV